jgi:5-methylcytosine-specific restriction endonuclease McrA
MMKRHKRKGLSNVQRLILAHSQDYMCVGLVCKSKVMLPSSWQSDHIHPLWKGGSNTFIYKNGCIVASNFQIICGTCHNLKTQEEYVESLNTEPIIISPYFNPKSSKFLVVLDKPWKN